MFDVDVKVFQDVEIMREFIGWTEDWEKEFKRKNFPVVEARLLASVRIFPLSVMMGKSLLLLKENMSFAMEELMVGNSFELVLMKMLKMIHFSHFTVTMVQQFQQSEGDKVLKPPFGSPEERQCDPMEDETME